MIDDVSCIAHALGYRQVTDINRIFSFFRETGLIADLAEFLPLGSFGFSCRTHAERILAIAVYVLLVGKAYRVAIGPFPAGSQFFVAY